MDTSQHIIKGLLGNIYQAPDSCCHNRLTKQAKLIQFDSRNDYHLESSICFL